MLNTHNQRQFSAVGSHIKRHRKMKIYILTLTLILFGQMTFGQKTKGIQKDELLFEQGLLLHQLIDEDLELDETINSEDTTNKEFALDIKETILEKSIKFYQELIDSFPQSNLLFRALNNKGFAELTLKKDNEAKKTFQKILDSKADDKEKGGIGSGIMAEPYANYKNRAAKILASICIKETNYEEALKYLDLTKKYPYRHFCGNEYAADDIYMSELYAKCYLGLNDTDKALKILLPNLLENGLASNSDLVVLTTETLLKKYSKDELKTLFENAFKTYKTEKIKPKNSDEYEKYYITFLDTDIEISSWRFEFMQPDERQKEIESIYKKSKFYKLLNE